MTEIYDFDVAFSFLAQDEQIALSLNKLLKNRVKTFICSEQQKTLAGTDGEESFNEVFSSKARLVVILYRYSWGSTPWTRIEETAIKNRAHDEGYNFTIWIPLDKPAELPKYVPKTRLYLGLDRWGIESAASVIESRITEHGGNIRELSLADKVAIAEDEIKHQKVRESLISSHEGSLLSVEHFNALVKLLRTEVKAMQDSAPDWFFRIRQRNNGIDIISYGYQLTFQASYITYQPHVLSVHIWKGVWPEDGLPPMFNHPPTKISGNEYMFDMDKHNQHGWSKKSDRTGFSTNKEIIQHAFNTLLKEVKAARLKESKNL
jgi:hypothetical protein